VIYPGRINISILLFSTNHSTEPIRDPSTKIRGHWLDDYNQCCQIPWNWATYELLPGLIIVIIFFPVG